MIWDLLFSFSGIFFGLLLGKISSEELNLGRRYLYFLLAAIFLISIITGIYFLFSEFGVASSLIFAIAGFSAFLFSLVKKAVISAFLFYPLFILTHLFVITEYHQLVLSSLSFLFGLPLGSLLMLDFNFSQKKVKYTKST